MMRKLVTNHDLKRIVACNCQRVLPMMLVPCLNDDIVLRLAHSSVTLIDYVSTHRNERLTCSSFGIYSYFSLIMVSREVIIIVRVLSIFTAQVNRTFIVADNNACIPATFLPKSVFHYLMSSFSKKNVYPVYQQKPSIQLLYV
jgi:hypothetical protein